MGFFGSVWSAVKSVGSAVVRIAKKAWEFASGPSAKSAYDQLGTILEKHQSSNQMVRASAQDPDFFGGLTRNDASKKLEDFERNMAKLREDQLYNARYMAIQMEFSRLHVSAELIDASMANVKVHAASLATHFQNMRNIRGLVGDVNSLRNGLRTVITTFNYNMNLLGAQSGESNLLKIDGVDIDKKDGAISMIAAFDAFDRTRQLLAEEIIKLTQLAKSHNAALDKLKNNAAILGGDIGYKVNSFIDESIKPIINKAESAGYALQKDLCALPVASRDDTGRIVFDGEKIKFEEGAIVRD